MLTAFREHDDSHVAFAAMSDTLASGSTLQRNLGGQGFSGEWDITWHADVGMWSLLDPGDDLNRFWCCFGIEDPTARKDLNIAVEVNPPHSSTDGRIAGAFAWSPAGNIHLCHNGRIGGGRRGVGKAAFFNHYRGELTSLAHRDRLVDVVDLGPIDSPDLASRLAWFAGEVLRIKALILQGTSTPAEGSSDSGVETIQTPSFNPEFSGVRAAFTVRKTIEARADHGLVVDALAAAVTRRGRVVRNDRERDLFLLDEGGHLALLFEVKTDISTTSIYTAVGQLLLNRGNERDGVRLVLVVPGTPKKSTRDALGLIGIHVLPYHWRGRTPVISKSALAKQMR